MGKQSKGCRKHCPGPAAPGRGRAGRPEPEPEPGPGRGGQARAVGMAGPGQGKGRAGPAEGGIPPRLRASRCRGPTDHLRPGDRPALGTVKTPDGRGTARPADDDGRTRCGTWIRTGWFGSPGARAQPTTSSRAISSTARPATTSSTPCGTSPSWARRPGICAGCLRDRTRVGGRRGCRSPTGRRRAPRNGAGRYPADHGRAMGGTTRGWRRPGHRRNAGPPAPQAVRRDCPRGYARWDGPRGYVPGDCPRGYARR
jgi:hypothetical protein